ncbi:hypothetical protein GPJ56_005207 [Histomonas meleagridis]|uniref:uncharacterized protein n=1 Tax=Histomonas meleagridis TaxID=135588 RepID=UPI0035599FA2|nr:hypothetical protein GPJ56_005207 [Histomonas meleagridis]KAH0802057.1 hypothetical protein GO595_005138 [Histomonas meleagridis]
MTKTDQYPNHQVKNKAEQKPTERQQFGSLIHRIIRQFELTKNIPVRFSDIADCDKRRQSDLYNILEGLEVFGHYSDKLIIWKGLSATSASLIKHGIKNELRALEEPITSIFSAGPSPSLTSLVKKFLSLYVFLGVDCLNIKEVANLMGDSPEQAKKILRRLYLIVFVLEQVGVLEHGFAYSQYVLKQPLSVIIPSIFQEVARLRLFPDESVEALLNRIDDVYIKVIHHGRKESYSIAVKRFSIITKD